jgi:hypothetical protein
MTSMPDAGNARNLYVTSKIKKFPEVKTLAQYRRIASRISRAETDGTGNRPRLGLIHWLSSWSRSDKLAFANFTVQTVALIVGVLALLIVAGLLIL